MSERLTANEADVLWTMEGSPEWVRPMDIGGHDGSHHSRTLARLAKRGLVERKRRAGWCRPSYLYRITDEGNRVARESRRQP